MCAEQMEGEGHRCTSIEGSMDKVARDAVVKEFRDGTTKILISTDVLSRGFDVTQVCALLCKEGSMLPNVPASLTQASMSIRRSLPCALAKTE